MRDLLIQASTGIVQLAVLVITTYVFSLAKKTNILKYAGTIKSVVLAVEQEFPGLSGADKKAEVIQRIYNLLGHVLTPDEISNLIEAAVKEMNMVLKNVSQITPTVKATQQTQAPIIDAKLVQAPAEDEKSAQASVDNTAAVDQPTAASTEQK